MTIAPLPNGGAALTGKSGRKRANAGDTNPRQTSMHNAAHFMFAKIESRQSRVERKALVFFPTLNKRLSSAAFSFDSILAVGPTGVRRSGGGYFHLSLSSTEKTKRSSPKTAQRRLKAFTLMPAAMFGLAAFGGIGGGFGGKGSGGGIGLGGVGLAGFGLLGIATPVFLFNIQSQQAGNV
jgi:hypothetical protein